VCEAAKVVFLRSKAKLKRQQLVRIQEIQKGLLDSVKTFLLADIFFPSTGAGFSEVRPSWIKASQFQDSAQAQYHQVNKSHLVLGMEKQQSFKRNKDSPGKRGDTALHLAARAGSVAHVQRILAECDPELLVELAARQNQDGETALYVSAEKGHVEVVCEILKASDVQSAGLKASNSFDAFHIAAKQGHLGEFSFLVIN
jgi:hypothetical protein